MKRRILSLLLVFSLLVALLPRVVLPASAVTASGTCGDSYTDANGTYHGYDLTWSFDDSTGVLTISGSGAMQNWYNIEEIPWREFRSQIKSVDLGDGITTIGNMAFAECVNLTSVDIPDSVTSIGAEAFYNCEQLTSISVPDNLTSIGFDAFAESGYYWCYDNWDGEDAVLYLSEYVIDSRPLVANGSYSIREGTRLIADGAFWYCDGLTSITIPDSVIFIGEQAFEYCVGLTSLIIPDSVTSIGKYAFMHCIGLTSVTIPHSVTTIGACAFRECTGLTAIAIPDGVTGLASTFYDCCNL